MWLASLEGGQEILAQAPTLEEIFAQLNELDLAEGVSIAVFWTGEGTPPELEALGVEMGEE